MDSVFAMEICAPFQPGSPLHEGLKAIVANHAHAVNLQQKWAIYRQITDVLLPHVASFELGCWDFFDDDARAKADFAMWCNGLFTEEGSRKAPSGVGDPYRGEVRYLTFTMSLLLVHGTPTERMLAQRCAIPKEHLWRRDVFHHLIEGIPHVNFASVKADVLYLIPRDNDWGLTKSDLQAEKFKYLRTLG